MKFWSHKHETINIIHGRGTLFVMVQGSLYSKPTLYTVSRDGEPEYPIKINGKPVTADMIEDY